jgi:hypothetical protein
MSGKRKRKKKDPLYTLSIFLVVYGRRVSNNPGYSIMATTEHP